MVTPKRGTHNSSLPSRAARAAVPLAAAISLACVLLFAYTNNASNRPRLTGGAATMSTEATRRKGAILGSIVADVATTPLHWIYDTAKLSALLASKGRTAANPEFFEPPSCPFYEIPAGSLSPYGAEVAALLGYADTHKAVDGPSWATALADYFTGTYPGYRNKSIKTLIANLEAGKKYPETGDATDTQANAICKVPVVVARFAGSPELPAAVEAAVRAQQSSDAAVEYGLAAARILERVVGGASIKEAIDWATKAPEVPERMRPLIAEAAAAAEGSDSLEAVSKKYGSSCALPGALQVALVAAARAQGYEDGIRSNILIGGDNCSRGCFLGAVLGAAAGGVPAAWGAKVNGLEGFAAAAERVAAAK